MAGRTFAIGDIHGETSHLFKLMACLPKLDAEDTLVFVGDYIDRGPKSADVVRVRALAARRAPRPRSCACAATTKTPGSAWSSAAGTSSSCRPATAAWPPCARTSGGSFPQEGELPKKDEQMPLTTGSFFPDDVVDWFKSLPYWYEDEHAIYVHAGLPRVAGEFVHPSAAPDPQVLLWLRDADFFKNYRGKTGRVRPHPHRVPAARAVRLHAGRSDRSVGG